MHQREMTQLFSPGEISAMLKKQSVTSCNRWRQAEAVQKYDKFKNISIDVSQNKFYLSILVTHGSVHNHSSASIELSPKQQLHLKISIWTINWQ